MSEHGEYSGVALGWEMSDSQVAELAMLVARLARALKLSSPNNTLSDAAVDYLRRNNL